MASKLPWFRFHQDDWLAHARLRRCSVEARGVWIDLVCMMRQEESGTLNDDIEGMARSIGLPSARLLELLEELSRRDVAEVAVADGRVSVTSRRVTRDLKEESRERDLTAERTREYRSRRRDASVTLPSRSCDAAVTPLQRSCDAAVTLEIKSQSQIEIQKKTGGSPATPTLQTSDGLRAGAREPESEVGGREVPKAKSLEQAKHPPGGATQIENPPGSLELAPRRCTCVEGFDASAGQCCRRCERGRERARRVTTAARADDAQAARAASASKPRPPPTSGSYAELAARIGSKRAAEAVSPVARGPPTVQVAP